MKVFIFFSLSLQRLYEGVTTAEFIIDTLWGKPKKKPNRISLTKSNILNNCRFVGFLSVAYSLRE